MKKREYIAKYLPEPEASVNGGQKPASNRACFEGILWLLRSGARYKDIPKHFPSGGTCWRRLRYWATCGALQHLHHQLLRLLDAKGKLNRKECFGGGTFCSAKKGVKKPARQNAAREQR